jgi:glycosyltransferase involved in cell wall biosynthesis
VSDGQTGILTPAGDTQAFANAVRRLIANPEERRRLSHNGRHFVLAERSLEKAASKLAAILAEHIR